MNSAYEDVLVECSEVIDRPADVVWQSIRKLEAIMMPSGIIQEAGAESPAESRLPIQFIRASQDVSMEQRVIEIDDTLMVLRMEMAAGQGVPWSFYQSRLRIEPVSPVRSRATLSALATPTLEPKDVEGMLRGMILLSLKTLKERVGQS